MRRADGALHRAGQAHSFETWQDGKLVGRALRRVSHRARFFRFGASMFSPPTDASKLALVASWPTLRARGFR